MNQASSLKRSIVFFLVPNFSMIAFATAIEPLRIANRMLGYEAYRWRLTSTDGHPIKASNGVECAEASVATIGSAGAIVRGCGGA